MNPSVALLSSAVGFFLAGCGDTPMPPASEPAIAAQPEVVATGAAASPSVTAGAPSPPSSIEGALPASFGAAPLAVRFDAGAAGCKPLAIADLMKKLPESSPVALFEVALGDKGCVSIPNDQGLEVAGVVLAGRARLEADGTKAPIALDAPWTTFRAPGAGLALRGVAGARVLVVVVATSGEPIAKRKPGKPWAKRSAPPTVVKLDAMPDLAWGKGAYHARIAFSPRPGDAPALAVDSLLFSPDAGVAEHVHDKQWECLVAFEGDGELVQKPGAGAADLHDALAPGAIVCVPPNRPHSYVHGKARLVALQVYAPPGPEERYVKLANP
jgi:mannose-6-phosphate isomerase-like protein (cupin superfamily)